MSMSDQVTIALAGNPNCGKTTIFNWLTGARQHVGNYPGITVEKKSGEARLDGERISLVDLPGTYSLTAYSQEELVARRMLVEESPDVVVHIVDAGSLERNLYLMVQLRELGVPVMLALNMMDEVRARGDSIDVAQLSEALGLPVVETVGRTGEGLEHMLRTAIALARKNKNIPWQPLRISYGPDLDSALDAMVPLVEEDCLQDSGDDLGRNSCGGLYPPRWVALKFLENDQEVQEASFLSGTSKERLADICAGVTQHLADTLQSYPEAIIADYRYGYVTSILRRGIVTRHKELTDRLAFSDNADRLLTHRLLGPLIMAAVFYCIYGVAFELGSYPMNVVEAALGWLGDTVSGVMPDGLLKSLLVSGIIKGVGGVLVFVPLILIMFFLIALLEDSGYMARIAYMLDRVFRFFGLHGSSVMPFIISGGIAGGCAVPGIMATRTLRSPKEKLATILTVPFMACGAKIPVFLLLVGVFFAENQAFVMLLLTLLGWVMALLTAWLLRSTLITGQPTPFVMELPPYRLPTLRGLLIHTWDRGWQYLKKAGTIILAISILLWAAMTFPGLPESSEGELVAARTVLEERVGAAQHALDMLHAANKLSDAGVDVATQKPGPEQLALQQAEEALETFANQSAQAGLRHSLAGRVGIAFEPVSQLAGFDWRTNIALVGGLAAKEVLVSTLGTAFSLGEVDPENAASLADTIRAEKETWNKATAVSLLVFVLLYAPCIVAVVAMRQETGGWKWPLFSVVFNTLFAFGLSVIIYQVGVRLI